MGYHVHIVRTSAEDEGRSSNITPTEISSAAQELGFSVQYGEPGVIDLISKTVEAEEVTLFVDNSSLWTKNPSDLFLEQMLEVAKAIGEGARVRGDEGETYTDKDITYTHPHDIAANAAAVPRQINWATLIPSLIQKGLIILVIIMVAANLIKRL